MKAAAIALTVLGFSLTGCAGMAGLEPLSPETSPTSRPELRWEPLPTNSFGSGFTLSEVRYDLRVFHGSALVYSRDGLLEPQHRLEITLTPNQAYSWTVRARFRVDGSRRLTDWTQKESSGRRNGIVGQASATLVPLKIEPLPSPSRREPPRTSRTRGS